MRPGFLRQCVVLTCDSLGLRPGLEFDERDVVCHIVEVHLHRHLDQTLTLTALRKALTQGSPSIHHSDQGVQYAAHDYVALLEHHQVQISMAEVGKAWQNGYAERPGALWARTIKEEEVALSEYLDFADAYASIAHFIEQVYQHKRIHSALGYLTPGEFEAAWQQQSVVITSLKLA